MSNLLQLNALAQSDVLSPIAAFMWDQSDFFISSTFDVSLLMGRLRTAYEEHELVCQAVTAKDPDGARKAMEDHILAFAMNMARS